MSDTWLRFPYAKKPYADSTLRNMTKAQLIQVIRDYEHNYAVLYEANERGIAAAEKMIQDEPAVDVKLVVKGEKVEIDGFDRDWVHWYRCSVCGYDALFLEDNYCSHCGADLRGDNDA